MMRGQRKGADADQPDISSRMELGAPLSDDDVSRNTLLPAKQLDAQHLGIRILAILCRSTLLLGCPAVFKEYNICTRFFRICRKL